MHITTYYHLYGERLKMLEEDPAYYAKGSGIFRPLYLCLSREVYLPEDRKTVPFKKIETGRLRYGNANPSSSNYDSLADFAYKNNIVEIRIPWQLLNIMDPSARMAMADFHEAGTKPAKIGGMHVSFLLMNAEIEETPQYAFFTWEEWKTPKYHERLKKSYDIVKRGFQNL